jgi:signal transduction histidine kinase
MLKNMKVTTKLVAILVAPVLVLVALAFVGVRQRQADASEAQRVLDLTDFVGATTALLKEVELEGFLATRFTSSNNDTEVRTAYEAQQKKTDQAAEGFRVQVREVGLPQGLSEDVDTLEQGLSSLATHRQSALQRSVDGDSAAGSYGSLAESLTETVTEVASSLEDPQLFQRMTSVANVAKLNAAQSNVANRLAISVEAGFFPATLAKGTTPASRELPGLGPGCGPRDDPDTPGTPDVTPAEQTTECKAYSDLIAAQNQADASMTDFTETASPDDLSLLRAESNESKLADLVSRAIASGDSNNDLATVIDDKQEYADAAAAAINGLAGATDRILLDNTNVESVASIATAQANEAQRAALIYLLFAIGSIAVAAVVTYSVGRSITVPLKKLTNAAYTLSAERLPALVERLRNPEEESHESLAATLAPIDIQSRDEIGQLADSFNSIQQVTIEVAEEQSVLLRKGIGDIFINLARRNQTLLDRQIEFIDQLEANEEDPDQLDNLFKLDHLATRMRRNAESLLVLAGAEPPRRRGRPVALADVVRVAIGEVEDFARIQLLALDDATVGGNVAVDLAHLLSELMENATHFSPPDTMVEIVGHRSAGGYIISVSDQGIGMSPEQLAEANHQLARPPLVGLALSRSLGFIVIGRLAQRFDISVKLTASPSGGVTALVNLPGDLVTYEGEEAPPVQSMTPAPMPQAPPAPGPDSGDVVVIDRDPPVMDERYAQARYGDQYGGYDAPSYEPPAPVYEQPAPSYEQPAPAYEPPAPSWEPPAPVYEQPAPSYEQPAPSYQPTGRAGEQDEEFERGLQEILGEEREPHAPPTAPAPAYEQGPYDQSAYAPPQPARPRPEPIQSVAEQVAAASRAETQHAELTAAGLVRRTPKKRADGAVGGGPPITQAPRVTTSSQRSPEEVRKMLSRYRSGLNKGRNSADQEKADS